MNEILFIVSATIFIHFFILCAGLMVGRDINLPLPISHIFHKLKIYYSNCYVVAFGMSYQVYFWSNYFELFG